MEHLIQDWGLAGMFASAFISSSLLPGGSEALFVALMIEGSHSPLNLWLVATAGNTLGGMSSFFIGWLIAKRYTPDKLGTHKHQKALARVRHWGSPILLLSWLPMIGDPLCVAAGWLRLNIVSVIIFIAIGKAARYAALMALSS